ncbi:MAG: peroxidase-related enzyme [Verrucomicrobiota bacterium]|nr:peroxidase-related enzyme [Verrucomicrobiota bacterium]
MSWIATIEPGEAEGALGNIYQRIAGPGGAVDNVLKIHSLRPHTLEAHMALYKNVLHHRGNSLPKWLLETIGIFVSLLNGCSYCVEHHFAGLRRLLRDDARAAAIRSALETQTVAGVFDRRERAILNYAQRLTRAPAEMTDREIAALRDAGLDDGEILEVNQVASYFAYVNRTVLGLGVTTQGDTLGLSPGDAEDAGNWRHS